MKYLYAFIAVVVAGALILPRPAHAATASMYLTRSKSTVYKNETVVIGVYMNSSDPVNAVQANLSYPSSSLSFVSISPGSAFEIQAENSGGGGSVRIGRGTLSPKTGTKLIANVTFKALKSSGSASISFAAGSVLTNNGSTVSSTQSGTSVTLAAQPSSSPSTPSQPTTTPTQPSTTPTVTPDSIAEPEEEAPKDETPPKISDIVIDFEADPVNIKWRTDEDANTRISYGVTDLLGITVQNSGSRKVHKAEFDPAFLPPKTTIFYRIRAVDAADNLTRTDMLEFTTPGIPFTVHIKDASGQAVLGATVLFDGEEYTTSESGQVQLQAGPGPATITVQQGDVTKTLTINVQADSQESDAVSYELQLDAAAPTTTASTSTQFIGGAASGSLATTAVGLAWHHARRVRRDLRKDAVGLHTK